MLRLQLRDLHGDPKGFCLFLLLFFSTSGKLISPCSVEVVTEWRTLPWSNCWYPLLNKLVTISSSLSDVTSFVNCSYSAK